jgi:hypothetical protein
MFINNNNNNNIIIIIIIIRPPSPSLQKATKIRVIPCFHAKRNTAFGLVVVKSGSSELN